MVQTHTHTHTQRESRLLYGAVYVVLVQYDELDECGRGGGGGGRAAVDAIILVYSITSQQSFEFVVNQLRDWRDAADQTPVVVVANKTDLVRSRQVSDDGQSVSHPLDACSQAPLMPLSLCTRQCSNSICSISCTSRVPLNLCSKFRAAFPVFGTSEARDLTICNIC